MSAPIPGSNIRHARPVEARSLLVAVLVAVVTACGSRGEVAGPVGTTATAVATTTEAPASATGSASGITGPGSAATRPTAAAATTDGISALNQLAAFLALAQATDSALRVAAVMVNAGIGLQTVRIDRSAVAAVHAIQPHQLLQSIPGGLPSDLLRPALLVYSDLVSRRDALNRISEFADESPMSRQGDHASDLLRCLGNGASAASHFAADLAGLRSVAQAFSPVPAVPPEGRATADVAIRAAVVEGANGGCASCGGAVDRSSTLWPISWKRIEITPGDVWDGTIGTLPFRAGYTTAQGWNVELNAC